ncbi:type III pantothenate kinase [Spiroplasma taiwanense]|uniref:Type III pantothenate kinase n=1 Tax=Spiroplasma taiwanense CT-1 TaxID=1276220 RepID=S5MCX6_9MOLU|nr:type III pantothenate kinase [Spiroplasma taiwanense]AGR41578.1 putative transcriptional regulator [Spiroplasma taiwanense CT-1]
MKILLIDVGNTTIDFRIWDKEKNSIEKIIRPLTNDPTFKRSNALKNYFFENNIKFNEIVYVSVVPEWNDILRAFAASMKVTIYNIRQDFIINNSLFKLDNISSLGADFIANFYAVLPNNSKLAVISMGTASTITLIEDNYLLGTIICPGIGSSLKGLISNAALLADFEYEKSDKEIGKNTVDSINIGTYNSHYLMLKAIVRELKVNNVIFTGGYSNLFKEEIKRDNFIFKEDLIFRGLIALYNIKIESL